MPIIIAHEETCNIIVNGPLKEAIVGMLSDGSNLIEQVGAPCTCGGVQFQISKTWDGWDIHPVQRQRNIEPVDDTFGIDLARLILEAKQADA